MQVGVLESLIEEGMGIQFSCVKSPWFDESWIGRKIDQHVVKELVDMHAQNEVDIGGYTSAHPYYLLIIPWFDGFILLSCPYSVVAVHGLMSCGSGGRLTSRS